MLELIVSDAVRRAKKRVSLRGYSRLERQRALIREALSYIGWESARAQRDAQAFSGGQWEQHIRELVPECDRQPKPTRGHFLYGAKLYKLTPEQFELLLGDEPAASAGLAHLAFRMFVAMHEDPDGNVRPALFWTTLRSDPSPLARRSRTPLAP